MHVARCNALGPICIYVVPASAVLLSASVAVCVIRRLKVMEFTVGLLVSWTHDDWCMCTYALV